MQRYLYLCVCIGILSMLCKLIKEYIHMHMCMGVYVDMYMWEAVIQWSSARACEPSFPG